MCIDGRLQDKMLSLNNFTALCEAELNEYAVCTVCISLMLSVKKNVLYAGSEYLPGVGQIGCAA